MEDTSGPYCNESEPGRAQPAVRDLRGSGLDEFQSLARDARTRRMVRRNGGHPRPGRDARPEPQRARGRASWHSGRTGPRDRTEARGQPGPVRPPSIVAGPPLAPDASLRWDGTVCPGLRVLSRMAACDPVPRGHGRRVCAVVGSRGARSLLRSDRRAGLVPQRQLAYGYAAREIGTASKSTATAGSPNCISI